LTCDGCHKDKKKCDLAAIETEQAEKLEEWKEAKYTDIREKVEQIKIQVSASKVTKQEVKEIDKRLSHALAILEEAENGIKTAGAELSRLIDSIEKIEKQIRQMGLMIGVANASSDTQAQSQFQSYMTEMNTMMEEESNPTEHDADMN
jgi:hypothetical protein